DRLRLDITCVVLELKARPVTKHAIEARLVAEVVIDPNYRLIESERAGGVGNVVTELACAWVVRHWVKRQDLPADCRNHIGGNYVELPEVGKPVARLAGPICIGRRTTEWVKNSALRRRAVWVICRA